MMPWCHVDVPKLGGSATKTDQRQFEWKRIEKCQWFLNHALESTQFCDPWRLGQLNVDSCPDGWRFVCIFGVRFHGLILLLGFLNGSDWSLSHLPWKCSISKNGSFHRYGYPIYHPNVTRILHEINHTIRGTPHFQTKPYSVYTYIYIYTCFYIYICVCR